MTSTILAAADLTVTGGNTAVSIISLVLGLAALGAGIFTAIDANKYSDQAHQAAGAPKMLWLIGAPIAGLIGCACCFILGLIMPGIWFGVYKKKVEAAQGGGFGAPGFGGPQPYGGPPAGGAPGAPGGFPPPAGGQGGFVGSRRPERRIHRICPMSPKSPFPVLPAPQAALRPGGRQAPRRAPGWGRFWPDAFDDDDFFGSNAVVLQQYGAVRRDEQLPAALMLLRFVGIRHHDSQNRVRHGNLGFFQQQQTAFLTDVPEERHQPQCSIRKFCFISEFGFRPFALTQPQTGASPDGRMPFDTFQIRNQPLHRLGQPRKPVFALLRRQNGHGCNEVDADGAVLGRPKILECLLDAFVDARYGHPRSTNGIEKRRERPELAVAGRLFHGRLRQPDKVVFVLIRRTFE